MKNYFSKIMILLQIVILLFRFLFWFLNRPRFFFRLFRLFLVFFLLLRFLLLRPRGKCGENFSTWLWISVDGSSVKLCFGWENFFSLNPCKNERYPPAVKKECLVRVSTFVLKPSKMEIFRTAMSWIMLFVFNHLRFTWRF